MVEKLRIVIADDERPARSFLAAALRSFNDVEVVGEAADGAEAVQLIESLNPDLALLDMQMPEVDGLSVVRMLRKHKTPLIAFVTAYDKFAVSAFELNAVDYLLEPVEGARLRETIERARERLERADLREQAVAQLQQAAATYEQSNPRPIQRIPVRKRNEIVLVPVHQLASIVADGELLHLRTVENETHTISFRLRDLEARLDAGRFVRLGRGTLVNIELIRKVVPMPGGTYEVVLQDKQQFRVSRLQSRHLREYLLRL